MMNSLFKAVTLTKLGCYFLIIAAVGDLLIPFLLAPFCNKYNHLTMVMSLLGNKNVPIHTFYNIWLVLAGIMFLVGNFKLYRFYTHTSNGLSLALFIIIGVYAMGACVLSGIFSVGETKELLTVAEKIHGYGSVLGFFALTFAPLVIGILSIRLNDLKIGTFSFICFILAIIFFTLFVMADKERFAQTIISYEGLWQRLSLLCMYCPIIVVSCKNLV